MNVFDPTHTYDEQLFTCTDHLVSKQQFSLHQHRDYDLLVTQPQPSTTELPNYYQSDDYISHTNSAATTFDKLYQLVKSISLRSKTNLIGKFMTTSDAHLDLGAGTGSLVNSMNQKGYHSTGIEPSDAARAIAHKQNIKLLNSLDQLNPNSTFHTITLFHVLEHLPNLTQDLSKLSSLLHQNGRLIIAVPNFKSFDAEHYNNHWAAFDVPRHLWHFSRKGISQIASQHNLVIEKTKPMWFDSFYVALLSEQHKTGNKNWIKAFYIGLRSNISAIRSKEYSSIIYVLKKG